MDSIHLRHEFVKCISDPDLYAKFVAFNLDDQLARNRILFYETVEALEDLLSHAIPEYHQIRYNNNSYALQRFVTLASNKDVSQIPMPDTLLSQVNSIYDVYISLDATIEIGLPNEFHWSVTKAIHENSGPHYIPLPCSLFDDAVDTILSFLFEDVFLRFHALQAQPRSHSLCDSDKDMVDTKIAHEPNLDHLEEVHDEEDDYYESSTISSDYDYYYDDDYDDEEVWDDPHVVPTQQPQSAPRRHSLPTESLAAQRNMKLPEPMQQESRDRYQMHLAKRQSRRLQLDIFLAETAYLDEENISGNSIRSAAELTTPLSSHPPSPLPAILEEGADEEYHCPPDMRRRQAAMESPVSDHDTFTFPPKPPQSQPREITPVQTHYPRQYPSPPPSQTSLEPTHSPKTAPSQQSAQASLIHYEDVPYVQSRRNSASHGSSDGSLAIHHCDSLQVPRNTCVWVVGSSGDMVPHSQHSGMTGIPRRMSRRQSRESLKQAVDSLKRHRYSSAKPFPSQQASSYPLSQDGRFDHVKPIYRPDSLYSIDPLLPPSTELMEALQKVGSSGSRRHSSDVMQASNVGESSQHLKSESKSDLEQQTTRKRSFGWFFWRKMGTSSLEASEKSHSNLKSGPVSVDQPVKVHYYKKPKKTLKAAAPSVRRLRVPPSNIHKNTVSGPDGKKALLHNTIPSTFQIQQRNITL